MDSIEYTLTFNLRNIVQQKVCLRLWCWFIHRFRLFTYLWQFAILKEVFILKVGEVQSIPGMYFKVEFRHRFDHGSNHRIQVKIGCSQITWNEKMRKENQINKNANKPLQIFISIKCDFHSIILSDEKLTCETSASTIRH